MRSTTSGNLKGAALACAFALLAGIAVQPQPAEAARAGASGAVPALGAINTISGKSSGVAKVRLPKPAQFSSDVGSNDDFSIEGSGEFTGIMLRQLGVDPQKALTVLAARIAEGGAFGSDPTEIVLLVGDDYAGGVELPAGDYALHLITSGPARMQLRLSGLAGKTKLQIKAPTAATIESLPVQLEAPTASPVYMSGAYADLASTGMIFNALAIRGPAWAAGEYGMCAHQGGPKDPPVASHLPLCPLADTGVIVEAQDAVVRLQHRTIFYAAAFHLPSGEWGLSSWYEGAAVVEEASSLGVWLSYEG